MLTFRKSSSNEKALVATGNFAAGVLASNAIETLASNATTVKQQLQVQTEAVTSTNNQSQNTFVGKIGGLAACINLDENMSINVVSKGLFRKLRELKFKFFTSDAIDLKIGDTEYCGQFTSKISVDGISIYANFYIKDCAEDFAVINKKMAQQLKLISK